MTAHATFGRAVDVILASVDFQCAITHLENVVVYSPTYVQRLKDLSVELKLPQAADVSLKLKKCTFAARIVQYLGFLVGENGLDVNDAKMEAVERAMPPRKRPSCAEFSA
jgi:hypothetical protein